MQGYLALFKKKPMSFFSTNTAVAHGNQTSFTQRSGKSHLEGTQRRHHTLGSTVAHTQYTSHCESPQLREEWMAVY